MKIKSGFAVHELGGSTVVMAVDERAEEFNGMITLSGAGVDIWQMLQEEDLTEDQIVAKLTEKYEGDEAFIRADVQKFVAGLQSNGFLED